jgi:2-hydroxychromene-2-carboxylate isomerase
MAEKFQEQGGFSTMDPSPILRWFTSRLMTGMIRPERLRKKRLKIEKQRLAAAEPHLVEYFHQVEDGYSHLAAQVLKSLAERYDIELRCHLVRGPQGNNSAEPDLLLQLSRYDSGQVAGEYGLKFPNNTTSPEASLVALAENILAAQDAAGFVACAAEVGTALWAGDEASLKALAHQYGCAADEHTQRHIETGTAHREKLQHYSGAMFYYGKEWYWGVDRLYHLEKRLADLGADREPGQPMLVPRPAVEAGALKDKGGLTLEVYPSLRSPYTAISFDRTVKLAADTGVKLVVRPVLPMVMRGVPATRQKGMYIFQDTAREAREAGAPYGPFYDPIGEPARRCYSLYAWACEQGKGNELLSSFLKKAFTEGVNTNNDAGLKAVVESAGLDWQVAKTRVGEPGWEEALEANRLAMYDAGLWGVPSFRLLDDSGEPLLELWGQDRLWLVARKIQSHLTGH